jgi:hypothetical protein
VTADASVLTADCLLQAAGMAAAPVPEVPPFLLQPD